MTSGLSKKNQRLWSVAAGKSEVLEPGGGSGVRFINSLVK